MPTDKSTSQLRYSTVDNLLFILNSNNTLSFLYNFYGIKIAFLRKINYFQF